MPNGTTIKRHLSMRVSADDLDRIDELSKRHRLDRTDYLIRAALGELADPIELDARFDAIDRRLARVEALTFGE